MSMRHVIQTAWALTSVVEVQVFYQNHAVRYHSDLILGLNPDVETLHVTGGPQVNFITRAVG